MADKKRIHQKIKRCLGSKLSLESFLIKKEKLDSIYSEKVDNVFSLPSDICDLGIANDCAIGRYVDFHTESHFDDCKEQWQKMTKKKKNIF